jgi:hypothetical protein
MSLVVLWNASGRGTRPHSSHVRRSTGPILTTSCTGGLAGAELLVGADAGLRQLFRGAARDLAIDLGTTSTVVRVEGGAWWRPVPSLLSIGKPGMSS